MNECTLSEYVNARCGEVYLSDRGTLIFLCSLCNESFKGYGSYLEHILGTHDLPVYCVEEFESNIDAKNIINSDDENGESIEMLDDENIFEELDKGLDLLGSNAEAELDPDTKYGIESIDNDIESQYVAVSDQEFIKETDEHLKLKEEELSNTDETKPTLKRGRKCKTKDRYVYPSQGMFECPICKLSIKGKSNLEKHVLRHDDDNKRFQCAYCPKRFHVKFELRQHESSHTGERPYLCTICGRRFVSTGKLNEHTNMIHENVRNTSCEVCNKKFYSNKYLRRHMLTHTTERCHKCEVCGAAFKIQKTLSAHMKLHENKREYVCKFCDAQFNQRPALYSHIKTRHRPMLTAETTMEDTEFD